MNSSLVKSRSRSSARGGGRGVVSLRHDPGVNVSDVCGSSWWGILHGVAQSIHDYGCPSCGKHAISLIRYAHDLVNVSLDKPIHAPEAIAEWTPFARKLSAGLDVHQHQRRRPPKCRFDADTFATNPGAVARFMRDLGRAQKSGDAAGFVTELNSLCSTQQLALRQEAHPVKISGKCGGTECSLVATAGGRMLEREPRIKVPVLAVTHEGVRRAVKQVREELSEALAEQGAPAPPVREAPPAPFKAGPIETFANVDVERIPLQIMALQLDRIIPSNDPNTGAPDPRYPQELQPRNRERAANIVQVRSMAGALAPEKLLTDYHTLDRGAPVVVLGNSIGNRDFSAYAFVVSGNGRAMALQLAADQHPEKFEEYLEAAILEYPTLKFPETGGGRIGLEPFAVVRGLPAELEAGTRSPDYTKNLERAELLAEQGNVSAAIATSSLEQAGLDSAKMSAEMVARLEPMEDEQASLSETIMAYKNRHWMNDFLALVPTTEAAGLVDKDGVLNQDGVRRAVIALAMWAFGIEHGNRLSAAAFDTIDPEALNVINGTLRAVPRLAGMLATLEGYVDQAPEGRQEAAAVMRDELNINPIIARTVMRYIEVKRSGISIEDSLAQMGFEGVAEPVTAVDATLLRMYDRNKRSARGIAEFFSAYAGRVDMLPNPNQEGMFGAAEPVGPGEAERIMEAIRPWASAQGGMFEEQTMGSLALSQRPKPARAIATNGCKNVRAECSRA